MIIKKINIFSIYLAILPLCNLPIIPLGFIKPIFTIASLPIILHQFLVINKISKVQSIFIILFSFLIFYSCVLSIFSNETDYLIRSLIQYFCFALNYLSLSILFNDLSKLKISRFISIFLFIGVLNSLCIFVQFLSKEYPNPISYFFVDLINLFNSSDFYLKPNGIFPEASISSIFLVFTILPILESTFYVKSFLKDVDKIANKEINNILIFSFLTIILSYFSSSRLINLSCVVLIIFRISDYFKIIEISFKSFFIRIASFSLVSLFFILFAIPRIISLFSINQSIITSESSNLTRLALIIASLKASIENPFGLGMGVFKSTFNQFLPDWSIYSGEINVALGEAIAKYGITNPGYILDSKNYLGLLATDFGLPLILIMIYLWLKNFFKLNRNIKKFFSKDEDYSLIVFFKRYLANIFLLMPLVAISSSSIALPFLPLPFILTNRFFRKYDRNKKIFN